MYEEALSMGPDATDAATRALAPEVAAKGLKSRCASIISAVGSMIS
ncbi:hypothetical protein GIY23_13630 [Allosaccharopolyspora coralli]|uniref:Uncharacterized protein n=1 Tax=Allosaccharopolyspora coralli TaxID=2665642 RepID=A0A5Q3QB36_9PSEU|nr:hypothetical protein [Allosaccharopolyspora coralli]QGK70424.1 hypothetical protein GIY23_13630 [Allosaccharopolyspora coralli]